MKYRFLRFLSFKSKVLTFSYADGTEEVLDGRQEIEDLYGKIIRGFAYSDKCATTPEIMKYLRELNIAYACSAGKKARPFSLPDEQLCWMPTSKHTDPKLMEYAKKFVAKDPRKKHYACADPMLFYVWRHSPELDGKWEILEYFCLLMSRNENIWYPQPWRFMNIQIIQIPYF